MTDEGNVEGLIVNYGHAWLGHLNEKDRDTKSVSDNP
jgi:hypothetical protein